MLFYDLNNKPKVPLHIIGLKGFDTKNLNIKYHIENKYYYHRKGSTYIDNFLISKL